MSTSASLPLGGSQFDIPAEVKYLDGRYEKVSVRIRRVNTAFFRLSAPVHMPPGRPLTLFYCGNRIDALILYSNPSPSDGSFNVGITCTSAEIQQRREARLPVNVRALLSRAGATTPVRIKVVDMSRSGLGFTSPVELAVGLPVSIEFDDHVVFAEIRFCTRMGSSYRAGCAVEEVIRIEQAYGSRPRKKSLWEKLRSTFSKTPASSGTITLPGRFANQ